MVQLNSKKNISELDKVESILGDSIEQIEELQDLPITENEDIEIPNKREKTKDFFDSTKSDLLTKKKKGNKRVTRKEIIRKNTLRLKSKNNISIIEQLRKLQSIPQVDSKKNISIVEDKKGSKTRTRIIEYSVVFIIIGILGAVALPNLMGISGGCGVARDLEGKNAVGTLSRAQQSYHFDKGSFSSNLTESQLQTTNDLGVIIPESEYYNFSVETTSTVAYALAIPKNPQKDGVRSYSSAIFFNEEEKTYQQIMCQSDEIIEKPTKPVLADSVFTCPESMTEIR